MTLAQRFALTRRRFLVEKFEKKLDLTIWLLNQAVLISKFLFALSVISGVYVYEEYNSFHEVLKKSPFSSFEKILAISVLSFAIVLIGCLVLALVQFLIGKRYLKIAEQFKAK